MLYKYNFERKLKNKSKNTLWVESKIKEAKEKNEGRFVAPLQKNSIIEDSTQCNKNISQTIAFVFSF